MKPKHLLAMSVFVALGITSVADAQPFGIYANSIAVRNIATIQHSIATNTIQTFEGTMAAALGSRAHIDLPVSNESDEKNNQKLQYGKMPTYGEYNDDGTANRRGRNGGDEGLPTFSSLWTNWQHFDEGVKFDGLKKIDTNYDLITVGLAGGHVQIGHGISQWGLFGGYAGSKQKNELIDINENGGYMGVYSGYNIYNFNISASANVGAMFNDFDFAQDSYNYSNAWAGASIHATYNIAIDDTLTLQPGLYTGYTWVKSDDYILDAFDVTNSNLSSFELTPEIRAIKHIGAGWFGTINARYVFAWENGGRTTVDNVRMPDLDSDGYVEYGVALEKSIDRFNISVHVGRRDGGHNGWNGGTSFKYIF